MPSDIVSAECQSTPPLAGVRTLPQPMLSGHLTPAHESNNAHAPLMCNQDVSPDAGTWIWEYGNMTHLDACGALSADLEDQLTSRRESTFISALDHSVGPQASAGLLNPHEATAWIAPTVELDNPFAKTELVDYPITSYLRTLSDEEFAAHLDHIMPQLAAFWAPFEKEFEAYFPAEDAVKLMTTSRLGWKSAESSPSPPTTPESTSAASTPSLTTSSPSPPSTGPSTPNEQSLPFVPEPALVERGVRPFRSSGKDSLGSKELVRLATRNSWEQFESANTTLPISTQCRFNFELAQSQRASRKNRSHASGDLEDISPSGSVRLRSTSPYPVSLSEQEVIEPALRKISSMEPGPVLSQDDAKAPVAQTEEVTEQVTTQKEEFRMRAGHSCEQCRNAKTRCRQAEFEDTTFYRAGARCDRCTKLQYPCTFETDMEQFKCHACTSRGTPCIQFPDDPTKIRIAGGPCCGACDLNQTTCLWTKTRKLSKTKIKVQDPTVLGAGRAFISRPGRHPPTAGATDAQTQVHTRPPTKVPTMLLPPPPPEATTTATLEYEPYAQHALSPSTGSNTPSLYSPYPVHLPYPQHTPYMSLPSYPPYPSSHALYPQDSHHFSPTSAPLPYTQYPPLVPMEMHAPHLIPATGSSDMPAQGHTNFQNVPGSLNSSAEPWSTSWIGQ